MSSSIFDSETAAASAWKRWLGKFLTTLSLAAAAILASIVLLDPYSTGRLSPITRVDITVGRRLFENAARVRDLRFDAAIFGNSHAYRLEPARLDRATGRHFVQLAISMTYPNEHMFLMRQFDLRRRERDILLVLVLDHLWCAEDHDHGERVEVPRWLYAASDFEYVRHLFTPLAFRGALRRLLIFAGLADQAGHIDGYETEPWIPHDVARRRAAMSAMVRPAAAPDPGVPFPFIDELDREMAGFDPRASILLMFPPVHVGFLPRPRSRAEARFEVCKARIRKIAGERPRTAYLDLRIDGPIARDVMRFGDPTHYDEATAREITSEIASAIRSITAAR